MMHRFPFFSIVFAAVPALLGWTLSGCASGPPANKSLDAPLVAESESPRVTVSGISSGGHMATQLHVARPDLFSGAAVLAAGPWGCAEGNVMQALGTCIKAQPEAPSVDRLEAALRAAADEGAVGDSALLADDPVWLYRGSLDAAVAAPVMQAAVDLYGRFVDAERVVFVEDVAAGHHFPTEASGHACDGSESPWIGACGFDAAGQILAHLHGVAGPLEGAEPSDALLGETRGVPVEGAGEAHLLDEARLFVPSSCREDEAACDLHVVLHGCLQSEEKLGVAFVEGAGYQRWAEVHGIRLLFPQVRSSASNPLGCWDWWGYTGPDYLGREAPQIRAITATVEALLP